MWEKELCAHAIFNEYFVAGLNRTGKEGNYVYYGQSVAFDPAGEMLAQASSDEEVLIIDCDLDLITQRRRAWQFYRDRRRYLRHTHRAGAIGKSSKLAARPSGDDMRKAAIAVTVLTAMGFAIQGRKRPTRFALPTPCRSIRPT